MHSSKTLSQKFAKLCSLQRYWLLATIYILIPAASYAAKPDSVATLRSNSILLLPYQEILQAKTKILQKLAVPGSVKKKDQSFTYELQKGLYCQDQVQQKKGKPVLTESCSTSKLKLQEFWENPEIPPKVWQQSKPVHGYQVPQGFYMQQQQGDVYLFLDSAGLLSWEIQVSDAKTTGAQQTYLNALSKILQSQYGWQMNKACVADCRCYQKTNSERLIQCLTRTNDKTLLHQFLYASPVVNDEKLQIYIKDNLYNIADKK